ncbi:MAG TPA: FAD-dependent oxidoreductase [Thermoanaerobaculia bacterium]|nr:FAD-dependent oxidoreductase [Thermoanaerobaculia bacterium]
MSRTPLFRTLRRSFRLAQRSVATGTPPDAVVEEWREAAKLSRRQFIGGTAAAAGLAMVGCRPFAPRVAGSGGSSGERIVIVGAGISGLTAGYRLHQQGADVRILEGQERVGGRMYSQRGFFPGQVAELGGELIDTGHVHMRQLAEELEIPLDDFALDGVGLDRDVLFFDGRRIQEHEVVEAFVPLSRRMVWDLATLSGDGVSFREPNGGEKLDRTPLSEWLAGVETPPWFRKLLDVAYTTEYGLETAEQSALNFLLLMDPNPIPFRIFSESDERFHVRSGNDSIPRALSKRLGNRVETSSQVEAVSKKSDGTFALSVRRGGTSQTVTADHVVITVPFTLLRPRQDGGPWIRLDDSLGIPEVQKKAIRELGYGTNSKLMVGFAKRLWRQPELPYRSIGSTLTDLPYQLCWETSRLQPGENGILTNFTGGRHGLELGERTPEEQAESFAREIDRVFPEIAEARLPDRQSRFIWPTFQWTLGSYGCYRPGQWTAFGGEEGRRVGNLHFAGEHTSGTAQGFMEGGCESGHRMAEEILEGRAGAVRVRQLSRSMP